MQKSRQETKTRDMAWIFTPPPQGLFDKLAIVVGTTEAASEKAASPYLIDPKPKTKDFQTASLSAHSRATARSKTVLSSDNLGAPVSGTGMVNIGMPA